ncbi:MAG TPA: endonuclease V, partial [Acidobacteriota bacterium]|nr:endonuclease V [Acidobacteriota bacterium]
MPRLALPHFPAVADARAAAALQRELAGRVRLEPLAAPPRTIAGTDLAFDPRAGLAHAAVVIVDAATLAPVAAAAVTRPVDFPYVPGLLSFREIPALLDCLEHLGELPDLFLCDGQGIAHPRGFGLAAHLGVLLDRPAIG